MKVRLSIGDFVQMMKYVSEFRMVLACTTHSSCIAQIFTF